MQNSLVSILTPFKNTEAFISDCVISIINQSYTNWELLIVDDHSTDNSFQLINDFAKNDKRIKLLRNDSNGIISALRIAFKHSKGEFITRMDSDDIMSENKLEILINQIKGKPKHVAIGLVEYFSEQGLGDGYTKYQNWLNKLTKRGDNYSEIYKECVIPSPCWMINREDLIACDAFNPNRYPEDYDLAFRFYEQNFTCIPCDKILHRWRDYSTRTSRTHEHYAENHFLDIKLHYFIKMDYDKSRPLTIWGAGNKGKFIARVLVEKEIPFYWICNNPKKIGKTVYNQELFPFNHLKNIKNPQSIITVANEQAQKDVKAYMDNLGMLPMCDYFFFC